MKCLVILASLCGLSLAVYRVDPLVSTKVGLIRGLRDDNGYAKFLGVPYGKVGKNIFGVAEPYPAFDDIFEAYDDSKICLQTDFRSGAVNGVIDCLNLNVYVPDNANSKHRLPVMVWIHGGAFILGSATEGDNSLLLRHDVIVVTVSYRLGVFGFMCLDIPEVPGNTGLKDQVLALRWIKENIEAFGGDANQITIFGESAGGMSINLHLFSLNEKLFNRAIIQSGPANSYWVMMESDTTIPIRIAEQLGFNTTDVNEALSYLIEVNPEIISEIASDIMITSFTNNSQPLTKPCVEKEFEDIEQFLTEHPINIKSSKASTTPVIIGYNSKELASTFANAAAESFDSYDFNQLFALGFDITDDLAEALETVKHFYIGDEEISEKVRWEIVDFASDFIFNHPTQRMAQKLLDSGAKTVYTYMFSYSGSRNKTWTGASHAEELAYLLNVELDGAAEKTPVDQLVADRMTELWTNFAKYGDPTPSTTELIPVKWTPITKTSYPYLDIDSDLSAKSRPYHSRMAFWDVFYKQYGHYQKWYKA